jgi:penicillin amidase
MPRQKFWLSLALSAALILFLNSHQPFGLPVPPLGKVLSPFEGFWRNAEPVDGAPEARVRLPGLNAPVEIAFDERMVPHVFAENMADAAFAQGYLHAKDRLWQMDISTRSVSGRLSEILGESTLELDRQRRRWGIARGAQRTLEAWQSSPGEGELIEAYTAGINAFIERLRPADYPLEFKLLAYAPEPWTPLKSALFIKNMALTLCSRADDVAASNTLRFLGKEDFDFFFPDYNPRQSPIIPPNVRWDFDPLPLPADSVGQPLLSWRGLPASDLPKTPHYIGSNNWAIAGSKTAGGHPIVANDPHLALTLPSIWYEIQLSTPDNSVYGVSLPGLPGVIIGFNREAAWGLTNVGHDVLDFYQIQWADNDKTQYLLDGRPQQAELVEEHIAVRGRKRPAVDTVRYTVWGPVALRGQGPEDSDLAMRWIANEKPRQKEFHDIGAFLKLMAAASLDDYFDALRGYDSPAQNFVFANRAGDIAIQVTGKFPLRAPQQGRFVQDGARSANAWGGFIPREHLPRLVNPERGFVASANQHSTDPSYPYYFFASFDDYRGRLINRRLDSLENITAEDCKKLQTLNYSIKAEEGLPLLLALIDTNALEKREREALAPLRAWNYHFDAEALAPALFDIWFDAAFRATFDELAREAESSAVLFPKSWRFIELLEQDPGHAVFDRLDTPQKEDAAAIVAQAWREVLAELGDKLEDPHFNWARHKGTYIPHLGRIPAFSTETLPVGGYREAPNAISRSNGPSWRMVVELGEEVRAYGIYPGGQSGNPGSPYYDHMIAPWVKGDYHELFFMREARDRRAAIRHVLILEK